MRLRNARVRPGSVFTTSSALNSTHQDTTSRTMMTHANVCLNQALYLRDTQVAVLLSSGAGTRGTKLLHKRKLNPPVAPAHLHANQIGLYMRTVPQPHTTETHAFRRRQRGDMQCGLAPRTSVYAPRRVKLLGAWGGDVAHKADGRAAGGNHKAGWAGGPGGRIRKRAGRWADKRAPSVKNTLEPNKRKPVAQQRRVNGRERANRTVRAEQGQRTSNAAKSGRSAQSDHFAQSDRPMLAAKASRQVWAGLRAAPGPMPTKHLQECQYRQFNRRHYCNRGPPSWAASWACHRSAPQDSRHNEQRAIGQTTCPPDSAQSGGRPPTPTWTRPPIRLRPPIRTNSHNFCPKSLPPPPAHRPLWRKCRRAQPYTTPGDKITVCHIKLCTGLSSHWQAHRRCK